MSEQNGMTPEETEVMNALVRAWNCFLELPEAPPLSDDMRDFRRSIHECQRMIAMRVIRRQYPGFWGK